MFNKKKKRIIELEKEKEELTKIIEQNDKKLIDIDNRIKLINYNMDKNISKLEKTIKTFEETTAENNNLKSQVEELKSERYVVKKVPCGRTPNLNKTKVSKPMNPAVSRFMKENFD